MAFNEIPLSPDNQLFSYAIRGVSYQFRVLWRGDCWILDISDSNDVLIIGGIPLVTGVNLMEQHQYMGLGFGLVVICDVSGQDYPTETDLGSLSHLYVITE